MEYENNHDKPLSLAEMVVMSVSFGTVLASLHYALHLVF